MPLEVAAVEGNNEYNRLKGKMKGTLEKFLFGANDFHR